MLVSSAVSIDLGASIVKLVLPILSLFSALTIFKSGALLNIPEYHTCLQHSKCSLNVALKMIEWLGYVLKYIFEYKKHLVRFLLSFLRES